VSHLGGNFWLDSEPGRGTLVRGRVAHRACACGWLVIKTRRSVLFFECAPRPRSFFRKRGSSNPAIPE
jgi:hypothetical protein